MTDAVLDAVASLKAAKNDLLAELRRIDDALLALGALTNDDKDATVTKGGRLTLKAKVLAVMEEQDKVWSAEDMLDVLTEDRFPALNATDPKSGIRTVFRRLVDGKQAVKEDYGRYRAAKWVDLPETEEEVRQMIAEEKATSRYFEREYDPREEPF